MPHYKDGTVARVGDTVKGRGYNVAHEIIGKVVQVRAGPSATGGCTLTVAYVGAKSPLLAPVGSLVDLVPLDAAGGGYAATSVFETKIELEYGDTVGFEKIA